MKSFELKNNIFAKNLIKVFKTKEKEKKLKDACASKA